MHFRRKIVIALGALAVAPRHSSAQPSGKMWRVGILSPLTSSNVFTAAFVERMRELGYVEGRNLVIEARFADGKLERIPGFAAELVQLKVDVILAAPATALPAKAATTVIPIVFVNSANPVKLGVVASLARPGGNITGISNALEDALGKSLELLMATIPKLGRVAVLHDPRGALAPMFLEVTQAAAKAKGVGVAVFEAVTPPQIDAAFEAIARERLGGVIVQPGPFLYNQARQVAEAAARHRVPTAYTIDGHVTVGGLMSYGPKSTEMYRQAARHVDKILKGTKPADIPVEQPTEFDLAINLGAAKALGLTFPPSVLVQVTKVIE